MSQDTNEKVTKKKLSQEINKYINTLPADIQPKIKKILAIIAEQESAKTALHFIDYLKNSNLETVLTLLEDIALPKEKNPAAVCKMVGGVALAVGILPFTPLLLDLSTSYILNLPTLFFSELLYAPLLAIISPPAFFTVGAICLAVAAVGAILLGIGYLLESSQHKEVVEQVKKHFQFFKTEESHASVKHDDSLLQKNN